MKYKEFRELVLDAKANDWRGSNLWFATQKLFEKWVNDIEKYKNESPRVALLFIDSILENLLLINCDNLKDVEIKFSSLYLTYPDTFNILNDPKRPIGW